MRIGIVGAGVAGLAAAYRLKQAGHEPVVFEKSGGYGGRCATRRVDDFIFDTGATSISPRGKAIEAAMLNLLDTSELVRVEKPIFTHTSLRVTQGDPAKNKVARYTYRSGITKLAKLLAEGIDVRLNAKVEGLEKHAAKGYRILGEEFDQVILTPPAPQTRELLASVGEFRPLQSVTYRSCLSVLLGYRIPNPEVNYHAILDVDQVHPLTWLSLESVKSPGRASEGSTAIVAQLSPHYSSSHYEVEDETILNATIQFVERLYGEAWSSPAVGQVKRWRYSQPEMTAMFDSVNRPGATLWVASDGIMGARVEYAFEAGHRVAGMILGEA